MDGQGTPILDCDFDEAISRIVNSDASNCFEWLSRKRSKCHNENSWTVGNDVFYADTDLTLDPKRYGRKVMLLREELCRNECLMLNELVDFIPEKHTVNGDKVILDKSKKYNYVEISDIGKGDFAVKSMRGWELPSRAKHFSEPHDIYFGAIWGSTSKWCYIPENAENVVVTNGCFRCRIKPDKQMYLTDLLAYMNSEGWAVQMRSFARGSDGLAEICEMDAGKVIIPILSDENRKILLEYVKKMQVGSMTINSVVHQMVDQNKINYCDPQKRPSHIVLV